jgi:spermidine/putrescine transport system permease protein
VRFYGWLLVLGQNGVVNRALMATMATGLLDAPLVMSATRFATVTGYVQFFVMLLTLTIYANLAQLSPNYARAAADLGAGRFVTLGLRPDPPP